MEVKEKNRKQYKKPQVNQVKLEVEEAVLAACKNPTALGKNVTGCSPTNQSCKSAFVGS
ncbi:MAG: hypothetical protein QME06_07745 [Desulfobacterales bacterium]|nr:hypothetical protein [Desulfobacterales bacterium]